MVSLTVVQAITNPLGVAYESLQYPNPYDRLPETAASVFLVPVAVSAFAATGHERSYSFDV